MLAEGIEVVGAALDNGLLHVDLERPIPEVKQKVIDIKAGNGTGSRAKIVEGLEDKS